MKKITALFNANAVVQKGEVFDLILPLDGDGASWDLKVTSGKATILSKAFGLADMGGKKGQEAQHFVMRAEQQGKLEIQATYKAPWWQMGKVKKSHTLKITVE